MENEVCDSGTCIR